MSSSIEQTLGLFYKRCYLYKRPKILEIRDLQPPGAPNDLQRGVRRLKRLHDICVVYFKTKNSAPSGRNSPIRIE